MFLLHQLKGGAWRNETYVFHEDLEDGDLILVSNERVIKTNEFTRTVDWTVKLKSKLSEFVCSIDLSNIRYCEGYID